MLAKVDGTPLGIRPLALSMTTIASKLVPTRGAFSHDVRLAKSSLDNRE